MKKFTEKHSIVEAILFLENSFISLKEMEKKAEYSQDIIKTIIQDINERYEKEHHAFIILREGENYLLAVKQDLSVKLSHLYKTKNQQKLSKALLETLSVIAYSQPVTKSDIDEIRGVNSDGAIKVLLSQNLIKNLGKKPIPGSPHQYGTTGEFLKIFGLKSIKELPKMRENDLKKFKRPHDDVQGQ